MPTSSPAAPSGAEQDQVQPPEPDLHKPGGGDPPARAVLVGVDGSECSWAAVRWAAAEAERRGASLRIVHAAPYLGRRAEPSTRTPEMVRARRIAAQAYTHARHTAADVHAETEIVPAEPAHVLLAEAPDAQILVLGIATTGALDELVVAPVAQRVVARSSTPVVVVPRSRVPAPEGHPVVAVLGLGDPDDDEPVVEFAADEARRTGVPLTVVRPLGRRIRASTDVDWAERVPDLQVTVEEVPVGTPEDLLRAIRPAPLLVLSAGHGSLFHRLLDGPHRYLLRHCASPMALIPPVHRSEGEPHEETVAEG